VIHALNENMPYNLFVKAQIADDLMPEDQRERLIPPFSTYAV
jgi:hypothetical protein